MIFNRKKQQQIDQQTMQHYFQQYTQGHTEDIPEWLVEQLTQLKEVTLQQHNAHQQLDSLELVTTALNAGIWEQNFSITISLARKHNFTGNQRQKSY